MGFATVERLRESEHGPATPVIFLSAHEKETRRSLRAYDIGAVDSLTEPFDQAVLRAKVKVFVELYLARRLAREQAALAQTRERVMRLHERADSHGLVLEAVTAAQGAVRGRQILMARELDLS